MAFCSAQRRRAGLSCLRLSEDCRQLVRLKAKRSWLALVCDPALRIDQVNTIGPTCIYLFRRVAKLIEHSGKLNSKLPHTSSSDQGPLFFIFRAGENDFVPDIALHLPEVAGMRLGDVHHQKGDAIAILLIESIEGRNLPPKWRSSVTAEHEHDGLLLIQDREPNQTALVHFQEREIRSRISHI
jgi:hypothetical protein